MTTSLNDNRREYIEKYEQMTKELFEAKLNYTLNTIRETVSTNANAGFKLFFPSVDRLEPCGSINNLQLMKLHFDWKKFNTK